MPSYRFEAARSSPPRRRELSQRGPYTEQMTVVSAGREHENLVEELIASVESTTPASTAS